MFGLTEQDAKLRELVTWSQILKVDDPCETRRWLCQQNYDLWVMGVRNVSGNGLFRL